VLSNILESIKDFDIITIYRHQFPDMDAIGSQFGLKFYLESAYPDKQIYCLGGSCKITENLDLGLDTIDDDTIKKSVAVILDTANAARIDDERFALAAHSIRIDHHVQVETVCDEEWIDDKASAACEMLALYFKEHQCTLPEKSAMMLYLGLTADNIRFTTNNVRALSFDAAKYLFEQGVDVTKTDSINFSKSMKDFEYETLVRSKAKHQNKFFYAIMEKEDYESIGLDESLAKEKVYVLSGIEGIEMWALFTRMEDGVHYRASLRARTMEIRDVAEQYGGGGHMCASGIKSLTIEQVHEIIDILSKRG
jgi:bifunctional oligoribonuclease and PAP phosphatase NrnA